MNVNSNWNYGEDPYAILGIRRGATTAQIRRAYIELLKIHHPDFAPHGNSQDDASRYVAALNDAYAILRNANRRNELDARLDGHVMGQHPRGASRGTDGGFGRGLNRAVVQLGSNRELALSEPFWTTKFVFVLITILAALFVAAGMALGPIKGDLPFVGFASERLSPPRVGIRDFPNKLLKAKAGRAVRRALSVSFERATSFSQECFKDAATAPSLGRTIDCVMFDDAVLMLQDGRSGDSIPPYFRFSSVRARHFEALNQSDFDTDETLDRIRAVTVGALVHQIQQSGSARNPNTTVSSARPREQLLNEESRFGTPADSLLSN